MSAFVDPRSLLKKYGLRPKRSFGQNFLVAAPIVERIAEMVAPEPGLRVIEIGAGLGTLTSALLGRGARVVAIERDRDLMPVLRAELRDAIESGALEVLEEDAAQVDLAALFAGQPGVLAGNLPYQITGRLIEQATHARAAMSRAVFMVQREVAERLSASPDGDAWGQASVFVQAAFDVALALHVSAGCFHPRPEVESAIVVLTPRVSPRAEETKAFRAVVHAAFGARRKTLKNALAGLGSRETFAPAGIDLGRRGETLTVEELGALAACIPSKTGPMPK